MLGRFDLTGIAPAPRGVPQIEVAFDIDANGILNVSAEDKSTGRKNKIVITNERGRLSKDQIDEMIRNAERFAEEDERVRRQVEAKNKLENLTYSIKNSVNDTLKDKLSSSDRQEAERIIKDMENWIDQNGPTASIGTSSFTCLIIFANTFSQFFEIICRGA